MEKLSIENLSDEQIQNTITDLQIILNKRKGSAAEKIKDIIFTVGQQYESILYEYFTIKVKFPMEVEVQFVTNESGKVVFSYADNADFEPEPDVIYQMCKTQINREIAKRQKKLDRLKNKIIKLAKERGVSYKDITENSEIRL